MVGTLESWVRRLVLARAVAAATGRDARATGAPVAAHSDGHRLVGEPEPLSRILVVRPDTVALVTGAGGQLELRLPGALLVPPLLTPGGPSVRARALSTAPVDLDVTVGDLVTFDGHAVERAVVRLALQLDDGDGYAALLELVAEHPDDLEEQLLGAVHREMTAAVRGAVRMNRLADLQRLTLAAVLEGRWLPARFGAGALRCLELRVQRVRWPGEDEPTVPVPVPAGGVPPLPDPPEPTAGDAG